MPNRASALTFKTPRLRLRPLRPGDEEFLASLDSDSQVMRYIHAGPLSPSEAKKWAKIQIEMAPHRWHLSKWIAEFHHHPARVGWVELAKFRGTFDLDEDRLSDDVCLGYQFALPYWNQGFAIEAARPVLTYAFETLTLDRVVAFTRTENVRSARVLEKLGFQPHPATHYEDEGGNQCRLYALWATPALSSDGETRNANSAPSRGR